MLRPSSPWLLIALCVVLLAARVSGAHLHFCLDGREAPASLHFGDAGHYDQAHVTASHDDHDLNLVADAVAKAGKLGLDLPVLLFAALLLWSLRWHPHPAAPDYRPQVFVPLRLSLRPPLRGPPRLTFL
ncbi:MAG: hypothetical protein AABY95_03825 [Pseudomonadota bacterium]